jgi:hypothetical protein
MKLALLRMAARHPMAVLLLLAAAVIEVGVIGVRWAAGGRPAGGPAAAAATATASAAATAAKLGPRAVLNRVWFDRYPRKATDEIKLWLFLAGGLGVYQEGSAYRSASDVFDFERQGETIELAFLHDRQKAQLRFQVTPCDEQPPFNLCLDLAGSPRGPRRYYGFGDEEDMAASIPWGRRLMRAARARAEVR